MPHETANNTQPLPTQRKRGSATNVAKRSTQPPSEPASALPSRTTQIPKTGWEKPNIQPVASLQIATHEHDLL
ncbi:hypothetical protein N431DRAFT_439397 [Stipitochalara longipes BDJ]|nr:hypothetical protein N431DRAFT_439397 [Stipitochalara longipes BDJ]